MGLAAGAVAELVDGGVGASAAGFGGAVAGVGGGLALAAVIDHALDDGLAKELDGKGDNGGLVDHDVIEQPFHGRSNLNAGNLIDVAQRDHDARDDFGIDTSGARGDDLGGAR